MDASLAIIIWLCIVIVSGVIVAYLAHRWGHDPFGWMLLTAVLGPIALIALIGTHQSNRERPRAAVTPSGSTGGAILVAADQKGGEALARHVAAIWRGQDVVVLHVRPHEDRGRADAASDAAPSAVARELEAAGVPSRTETRYGAAGEEIVDCARDIDASLIVVGRRGAGLTRALLGSTSRHVTEQAGRPVAVVG
jgi:nucleotide-binding universal stress UspA family protein